MKSESAQMIGLATVGFLSGRIHGLVESVSGSPAFTPPTPGGGGGSDNRSKLLRALPAVNQYRTAHGGWAGMTYPLLQALDDQVEPIVVVYADDTAYCITDTGSEDPW